MITTGHRVRLVKLDGTEIVGTLRMAIESGVTVHDGETNRFFSFNEIKDMEDKGPS